MRNLSLSAKHNLWGIAFTLPAVLFFCIFSFYPMFNTFSVSVTAYDLLTPMRYVGLNNFKSILNDPLFRESAFVTFYYIVISTVVTVAISLAMALLLNKTFRFQGLARAIIFSPTVISLVVVAMIWKMLFHPYGLFYEITRHFNPAPIPWLTDRTNALIAIVIARIWRTAGYYMVFFLAGLQNISQTYYEAAKVDGVNRFQQFRYITWPLLKPTTVMVLIISIINALRDFAVPHIMTGGGPAGATRLISLLIYETAFSYLKMGRAAAMSVVLFVFIMIFTIAQLRLFRAEDL
ncbi:MAG: carbohydrate ABC transporter permease [Limnochordia bacterium]